MGTRYDSATVAVAFRRLSQQKVFQDGVDAFKPLLLYGVETLVYFVSIGSGVRLAIAALPHSGSGNLRIFSRRSAANFLGIAPANRRRNSRSLRAQAVSASDARIPAR